MDTFTEPSTSVPSVIELKSQADELYSQGNYLAAIEVYSQGLALEPNNIPFYHNRGLAYLKLSNFNELRSNCDAILAIDPTDIKALVNRSFAFTKLGLIPEAINDLRTALNLGADDPNLAERLAQLEQQNHQVSATELKDQGNRLFNQRKFKEALECYNQALLLDPHNLTLYNNRGACFLHLKMYSELKANSDAVLALDPVNVKARVNRATASEHLGQVSEAIQDLHVALELNAHDRDLSQRLSKLEKKPIQQQVATPLASLPQNAEVSIVVTDPQHSESSPLLASINSSHHDHDVVAPHMNRILWFQLPGLFLSLGILGFAIYQATQSYDQYEHANKTKGFEQLFAPYFFVQLVGAIIQSLNSAHGSFAFLFRSAKGLEIYGGASTATIVWQLIQTIAFFVLMGVAASGKNNHISISANTIVGIVIGWVPIVINMLAVKLRFELLTWNLLTQFTFLDGCLCSPTIPDNSHCTPHALVPSMAGCCQKIYRCTKCGGEWKRT